MKAYHVASLIVLLTPLSLAPAAWAGNCTSPVIAWKTGFRLSGSGGPARGDNLGTYTVNEAATSVGLVLDYVATSTSCTTAEWIGNANVTGSVNDEEDQLCPPHSALGQSTTKLTGSAFGSVAHINIDLSTNKFTFLPFGLANVTFKTLECDGSTSPPLSEVWAIQPTEWGSSNGSPAVPPAFPLPSKVQPLSGELPPDFKGKTFFGGITIPWNLIFHADPVIDTSVDDPCEWIVGSRIGCQNQSLGEEFRLVGTGVSLHYESNRLPGTLIANSVAQADALANGGWTFNVHHVYDPTSQRLYLGDGNQRSQWQLGNPVTLNTGTITAALINFNSSGTGYLVNDILTVVQGGAAGGTLKVTSVVDGFITGLAIQTAGMGYSPADRLTTTGGSGIGATVNITTLNYLITNEEGSEVYVFSPSGVHLKTVKPLTGALKYQFTYDASGNLIAITDPNGNKTVINREMNGLPTSIVSPYGEVTTLTMNAQGFLSQMTDPAGHNQTFVYNLGGLMISRKDAGGSTYTYTYDGAGTLTKDANPEGGAQL